MQHDVFSDTVVVKKNSYQSVKPKYTVKNILYNVCCVDRFVFHQLKNKMGMNRLMIVPFKCHKHPRHLSSRKGCKSVANLCDLFGVFYIKLEKIPHIQE